MEYLKNIEGTHKAIVFDNKMQVIDEVSTRGLVENLDKMENVHTVVVDGIVTDRLAEKVDQKGVKYLMGRKKGNKYQPKTTEIICIS